MKRFLVGALWLVGCAEAQDALDPDLVAELARTPGDAQGIAISGTYDLRFESEECDCDLDPIIAELSLCEYAAGQLAVLQVDLVQADGFLLIDSSGFDRIATGSIHEDGEFTVGLVTDFASLVSDGFEVLRLDGTIEIVDGQHFAEGDLAHRLDGSTELSEMSEFSDVDCVERFTFEGFKRLVP